MSAAEIAAAKDAIKRLATEDDALGRYLEATIRTIAMAGRPTP